ncbi:SusC/RagA family TonB-linked outer membrane protein [Niastella sp. OAS944]|uniref:SusC/RagA family TonB-linked outer membrane protein n=1 Tax=Niastella sp. OAS944 TaxID=2664089 RepID=UPI0034926267|nr:TonB-linked SusC/RagA family outer membrane protein [Chitinophagaceae bacterium OAS944]
MSKLYKIGCLIFCLLSLHGMVANAQQASGNAVAIRGKVTDKKTKGPMQGVTVSEMDADGRFVKGTTTDIEGNYSLRIINAKNKISVSYVGYKSTSVSINGRTSIDFQLEMGGTDFEEVIVVGNRGSDNGLGTTSQRKLTTAVSTIAAKQLEEMQAVSIDQALQGRLAGVDITATSGDPGAAMNIRIRGVSSINSTGNPLIVVDGMPYETEIPSDFNFGTADEQGYAQLLNIAPADILTITVLKDAAATAVWGSRAASGVLIITTKRGTRGKPSVSYSFKGSTSILPDAIPMLNGDEYATMIPEIYMNRIGLNLNTQSAREFNYDPNDPYWYYNYSNNVNWVDAVSRQGYLNDHNLSINGGGEKAKYYASIGYFNQKGTTIGTALSRINTRINLDYTISDRIKIFTSIAYTHTDQDRNYLSDKEGAIRGVAYLKMPNMSIFEYDELGNITPNYFSPMSNAQGGYSRIYNPVAMASQAKFSVIGERVVPRFHIDYAFIKGVLTSSFDVQFDINNTLNTSFLPQVATGRPNTETVVNRAYNGDIDLYSVTTRTSLNYTPKFKNINHNLSAFFNLFTNDFKSVNQEVMTSNTASSLLVDPASPSRTQNTELKAVSGSSQTRSLGAVVELRYDFKDKYLFSATLRGDGNSRFGPAYRYGLFPGGSFAWRISDEKPFRNIKQLDDLRFRLSYALSGNAPRRDYSFYNTYTTYSTSYLGSNGVYPSGMKLENLRWETVHGGNAGLNISLFKQRLRADVDMYRNRTKDLFFDNLQIASHNGFNAVNMNVGTMDNQGWEIALWTVPYKNQDLSIGFDFNVSKNQNVIRKISEYYPSTRGDVGNNGEYMRMLQIDNPFGSFYGFKSKGVYADKEATIAKGADGKNIVGPNGQTVYMHFNYPTVDYTFQEGDAMYEDINHDGNINYMDVVYLGNSNPKLSGGFGPSVTWKNFKLSSFFSFRYDYEIVNATKMNTSNMHSFDNQSKAVLRRWRKTGDVTDIPRGIIDGGYNYLGSDRYVEDASYLRFRVVSLRYNFDKKFLAKVKMKTLSAFVTAENLYTWTGYTGQDPEVSTRGADPFRVASDNSMTPPSKTFTIGLQASF